MSLRDQLVAKGFASKKDKKRVEREKKDERRQAQGQRERKHHVQARESDERERARAAELAARRQRRAVYEEQKEQTERALRARNLVLGNRIRSRGNVRFHFVGVDGRTVFRLWLSSGAAFQVRAGELGIVAHQERGSVEYLLVPRKTGLVLREIAPHLVVVLHEQGVRFGPELGFAEPVSDPDLRAHRQVPLAVS